MSTIYSFGNSLVSAPGGGALAGRNSAPPGPTPPTPDPYNPLGLPAYTMRFRFGQSDFNPNNIIKKSWPDDATWTQVSESPNIWDFTYPHPMWYGVGLPGGYYSIFYSLTESTHLYTVQGANTTGVTCMESLFEYGYLYSITNVFDTSTVRNTENMFAGSQYYNGILPLFDFSSSESVTGMFQHSTFEYIPDYDLSSVMGSIQYICDYCTNLKRVPNFNFNVSNLGSAGYAFRQCTAVESGALSMYNKLSATGTILYHDWTFGGCGSDTTTGAAELAQIPASWGGTGA